MNADIYTIFWDEVEGFAREEYNEAFLVAVREDLKQKENGNAKPVYIKPRFYSGKTDFWACAERQNAALFESFTAAMAHTARRLKDCKLIAGFILPDFDTDWNALCAADTDKDTARALYIDNFKQAFAKKHGHYHFI